MSVTPPDPVLDSKFPLDHLDDLPLPGRPADSPRIDDDEITLPGHATSFLPGRFAVHREAQVYGRATRQSVMSTKRNFDSRSRIDQPTILRE